MDEQTYAARRKGITGMTELLCPDLATRVFLAANGVPGRWNFRLVAGLDGVSGRVPVVVLHDAGASGVWLVAEVRERWPGQVVVDAGMPVRAVRGNRRAVVLHGAVDEWFSHLATPAPIPTPTPDWLSHLTTEEVQWLSQGWYSPLAAVPPALLESAVVRAVRQATLLPLGFMSWPTSEKDGN